MKIRLSSKCLDCPKCLVFSQAGSGFKEHRCNAADPLLHSIALDPLYPSQCSWETFGYATGGGFLHDAEGLTPLRLSGQLNSLGCSVVFHQGDSVSMVKLIEQVRQTPEPES